MALLKFLKTAPQSKTLLPSFFFAFLIYQRSDLQYGLIVIPVHLSLPMFPSQVLLPLINVLHRQPCLGTCLSEGLD